MLNNVVSAAEQLFLFIPLYMLLAYKLCMKSWWIYVKDNSSELQYLRFFILFQWPPSSMPTILRYFSTISHTSVTRYCLNLSSTLVRSCWIFGSWLIASFINLYSHFAAPLHTVCPPRLKLTLPWWGGFPPRNFYPSASTKRAPLSGAAKIVRPTDLLNNVRYWFTIDWTRLERPSLVKVPLSV